VTERATLPSITAFNDEYYRQLFEALDQGFCTIELLFDADGAPNDYRFIDVNAAFEQQTGLHEPIGKRIKEFAPGHEEDWFRIYGDVATTGMPVRFEQEAAALQRWYDVYAFRIGKPELHRVAVLFRDITARKAAELRADRALREAEIANRTKDEFVAMLGHELRNPLAPMFTALQLMRLRGLHSTEQDILERQVKHLSQMVDDLLDVARIARGKIDLKQAPIELCQVVLTAMEMAGPLLEQRQHLVDVHVPQHGVGINVDRARMAQVLANLLTNAAKYSDPGSRIVVAGARNADKVTVTVSDEGIGLEPGMLASIFEPFVQQAQAIDRSRGGLGLGLAIVGNIVTAHDGIVTAKSDGHGRGASFTVELAAVDVPAAGAEIGVDALPIAVNPNQRILVVDDNADAAEMLRAGLEQFGYQVQVAIDGPSALDRARSFQPSTVLLDIGLPVMDGYEVARRLIDDAIVPADAQFVAITGYGQPADLDRSRDEGFAGHLVKPIDLQRLRALLERSVASGP
jgi:signal transduction histidine kinase/ActR/RegA family two-component response regulator